MSANKILAGNSAIKGLWFIYVEKEVNIYLEEENIYPGIV